MTDPATSFPNPEPGRFQVRLHPDVPRIDLEELRLRRAALERYSKAFFRLLFCFIDVLRNLEHWPPPDNETGVFTFANDFGGRAVEFNGCAFFESELSKEDLRRIDSDFANKRGLRFFFWIDNDTRTIWVLRVRWSRGVRAPDRELARVARRLHALKAAHQDLRTDE
jgi:hypothetical protein